MKGKFYIGLRAFLAGGMLTAGAGLSAAAEGLVPPFISHFDTQEEFDQYTVIDGNKDGVVWDIISFLHNLRISYNSQVAMDDWVVTPGLLLEKGKSYRVSALTRAGNSTDTERIEVKYGTAPTAEALVMPLIDPLDLHGSEYVEIAEYIVPEETGVYYVGFHGISKADTYQLHLDEISVEAGISALVPGVPTDFKVTPDLYGAFKADISLVAPVVTFSDETLEGKMTIEIKRENKVIASIPDVMPGQTVTYVDTPLSGGRMNYHAYAINEEGQGNPATANVHIGYSYPAPVESVMLAEDADEPGMITLSWPEITRDDNGLIYPEGAVKYYIYTPGDYGWNLTYRDIEEPSYRFRALPEGEQTFLSFAVCGVSEGGQGDFAFTGLQAVGTPFNGFDESFPQGSLSYPMIMETIAQNGMDWAIYSDESGVVSQDKDNGFLAAKASDIGDVSAIVSPKVSLKGVSNPVLSFYTYNILTSGERDINLVAVEVREPGGEYVRLMESTVDELCQGSDGWWRVNVDLSDYAGKVVQFRIVAECRIFDLTLFDNIRLGQSFPKDLGIVASAPAEVMPGDNYKLSCTVRNEGYLDVPVFRIALFTDGEQADVLEGDYLKAGEKREFEFLLPLHPLQEADVVHRLVLTAEEDANPDNNIVEDISVSPALSTLPVASGLVAEVKAEGVALSWDAPDLGGTRIVAKSEDFEQAESWGEVEGWTFIDRDLSPIGGFQGMELPGIPQQSLQSFFVFDTAITSNPTFAAHSGSKYIGSIFRSDTGTVDDWAISPELSGESQTISFYAQSYSGAFAEKIEILWSDGSLDPEDFSVLEAVERVPSEWTRYEAELPEGARRFAIRSCGTDTFMLMLDDFSFKVAEPTAGLVVEGYNIYRNRERINTQPVLSLEYLDAEPSDGRNSYVVTALYEGAESRGSQEATVDISAVNAALFGGSVRVEGHDILLTLSSPSAVRISDAAGLLIFDDILCGDRSISVSPGIYIVNLGAHTRKVIIR